MNPGINDINVMWIYINHLPHHGRATDTVNRSPKSDTIHLHPITNTNTNHHNTTITNKSIKMLARRGVIADQLSDSQVQGDTPQSAERRPEPQTTIEPSGTLTPSGSESASATSSSPHDNKAAPRQAQGKHHNHHNHHQWDNLPGITSEAEVLRQMREQGQEQQQSGNNRRPKHEATLEGQVGSTSRQGETTGKKQREISRGREGSAGESHG